MVVFLLGLQKYFLLIFPPNANVLLLIRFFFLRDFYVSVFVVIADGNLPISVVNKLLYVLISCLQGCAAIISFNLVDTVTYFAPQGLLHTVTDVYILFTVSIFLYVLALTQRLQLFIFYKLMHIYCLYNIMKSIVNV